ncbi:hypothetical protein AAVH_13412 [Aphelenchoides avenae]|nr:hypothetical protein AAVH_13412 [Aphelenchus avenae]
MIIQKINAPGEVLVDIAHCVDYGTLYSITIVNSQFHNVAARNAEKLAKRRNFELTFTETTVDLAVDGSEMLSALKEVANVVGLHAVTKVSMDHGDWLRLPIAEMFAVLPALEYATSLRLHYAPPDGVTPAADYIDAFVTRFPQVQVLVLALYRPFDWIYLRRDSALKLRTFNVVVRCESQSSEEEILRYCTALSRLPGSEPRRFVLISRFLTDRFRQEAVERIVEVLSETQRMVTLSLPTGSHLQLPERKFIAIEVNKDGTMATFFTFRRDRVVACVDRGEGFTLVTNAPKYSSD